MPKHILAHQIAAILEKLKSGGKKIKEKAEYFLGGGEYGKMMNARGRATPQGKAISESLEKEGFWETYKRGKRGEFNF